MLIHSPTKNHISRGICLQCAPAALLNILFLKTWGLQTYLCKKMLQFWFIRNSFSSSILGQCEDSWELENIWLTFYTPPHHKSLAKVKFVLAHWYRIWRQRPYTRSGSTPASSSRALHVGRVLLSWVYWSQFMTVHDSSCSSLFCLVLNTFLSLSLSWHSLLLCGRLI